MARSTSMYALVVLALIAPAIAQPAGSQTRTPGPLAAPRAKCNEFSSTVQIRTRVNATELAELGYAIDTESPEGTFDGPRLEYLGDRTVISKGDFCDEPKDNQILSGVGRSDYKELEIGSDDGSRTAAGDFFFKVYDKEDKPTDCIIKLSIDGGKASMTPEPQCPSNLQIVQAADKDLPNTNVTANPTPINSVSVFLSDDPSGDAPPPVLAPVSAPISAPQQSTPTVAPVAAVPAPSTAPTTAPVAAPVVAAVPKPAPAPLAALPPKPAVIPSVISPAAVAPAPAPSSAASAKLATAAAVVLAAAALL